MIRTVLASILCAATLGAAAPAPRPSPPFAVHLSPGQITPAQFKGKVVILAMIMTGCPHCQETVRYLSGLQIELGSRGLQVLGAAFNDDAATQVQGFIQQYKPAFPVGYASRTEVIRYLGRAAIDELWVPVLVFIDRKGMIRHTYLGDDPFFKEGDKNIRARVEQLLR